MDSSTKQIVNPFENGQQPFLTDLVKDDEKKGKKSKRVNWDTQKDYAQQVQRILETGSKANQKQAERVKTCCERLEWGWVDTEKGAVLRLKSCDCCRFRWCPICQWRRSKMWVARFFDIFPRIYTDYPKMRYILLTLTVANCPITELRQTVDTMNQSWHKLIKRKAFPALGFVRSLEVTKENDTYDKKTKKLIRKGRIGYAHPHFHVILAVSPSYFGLNYLSTEKWAQLWQQSLKVDYVPVCDVRIVKPKPVSESSSESEAALNGLMAAITEVIKYSVKPSDMVKDSDWFLELVEQLHKTRAISLGGIFKQYLSENDLNNESGESGESENAGGLWFGWREYFRRYQYNQPVGD